MSRTWGEDAQRGRAREVIRRYLDTCLSYYATDGRLLRPELATDERITPWHAMALLMGEAQHIQRANVALRQYDMETEGTFNPSIMTQMLTHFCERLDPDVRERADAFVASRMAHEAGCILTTGTDQVGFGMLPGYSLWREMEIFAEAGLAPMEVLKAATCNGAYALGRSDLLGSLENGKLADFVVLDADPLANISNVRRVHRVVKGGILYMPQDHLKPLIGKYH